MTRVVLLLLLACGVAGAQSGTTEIVHPQIIHSSALDHPELVRPDATHAARVDLHTQWMIEMLYDRPFLGGRGVEPDGRHLGVSWRRQPSMPGAVLVLRRPVPSAPKLESRAVRVVDKGGTFLIPTFLYPSTPTAYHPAFDAHANPLPPGAQVGEWTVVGSVDGDPETPIVDAVDAGGSYVYALVPALRGEASDTYKAFPGDAILTWSAAPHWVWYHWLRWFHLALISSALIGGAALWLRRRRRKAGAQPPAEAS